VNAARRHLMHSAVAGVIVTIVTCVPTAALAHPLGNFSVNQSHSLTLDRFGVTDRAVVDFAEIPTEQAQRSVDSDGDGSASVGELGVFGARLCDQMLAFTTLTVDSNIVPFEATSTKFRYQPGQAGLSTSRLECQLRAAADLSVARDVSFKQTFASDRVGWRELSAIGDGVRLVDSPVAMQSSTDTLRTFPTGALESPLNITEASLVVQPGGGSLTTADRALLPPTASPSPSILNGGPLASVVSRVTSTFNDLVGRRNLTVGVGLLAVMLALVLGASHALLPGHGKTVMAAYIAGRQGSARDAVIVGATVTATHTGGVLLLGLALTVSSALAGPVVLGWLGVASGLLIAVLGASLLSTVIRRRSQSPGHSHSDHSHSGHSHAHGVGGHSHGHGGLDRSSPQRRRTTLPTASTGVRPAIEAPLSAGAVVVLERTRRTVRVQSRSNRPSQAVAHPDMRVSRRGLVGMGVAGGLVPSPSALVVLLSAIALGRTAFGVLLVVAYGFGMAATLTAAGLILVRFRDRKLRRGRVGGIAERWRVVSPYATALLVVIVGVGLAARSFGSL
jgi:nickel/cobalt transporter (NicO) family protein